MIFQAAMVRLSFILALGVAWAAAADPMQGTTSLREYQTYINGDTLQLQPQALYLVRGKSSGRFRLDSRTPQGDLRPLDPGQFTWSTTKPWLIGVDGQGGVSCSGIGEGVVNMSSKDLPRPLAADVFCGEYTVEPPMSQLSPAEGNNQLQLSLFGITSDGQYADSIPASTRFSIPSQDTSGLISMDNVGKITVLGPPQGNSAEVWVTASVDGANTRDLTIVRITPTNLGMPLKPWRGQNTTIWYPDQVVDFNYKAILEKNDALRIADLIYLLAEEHTGLRPHGGGMLHLANAIGFENDPATPCGRGGVNPLSFGTRIDKPTANSCFILNSSLETAIPHWFVWGHEIGHNFDWVSPKFKEWLWDSYAFQGAGFIGNVAAESIASHHGCYALRLLGERKQEYGIPDSVIRDFQSACPFGGTYDSLKRYQGTGPDIRRIDVGAFYDIMEVLLTQYGWEAQRRFFSVFLPANEGFPFAIRTLEQQISFFVAAYSAATRTDLRTRFKKDHGFPIDEAWYAANYAAINRLVSQRDPAVVAGEGMFALAGTTVALNKAAAFDPSDRPLTYEWKIERQPLGSRPTLSEPKA